MREMKDSGVEWIGEIPESWATEQIGWRADQTKCKNDGMIETNLLSLSYGKVKRRDINATEGLLPESFEGYNIIEENDIVLRFTDLQNDQKSLRVGRATERGIITSAYTTIRPFDSEDSEFLYYALHSYDLKKGFYGMGAGVWVPGLGRGSSGKRPSTSRFRGRIFKYELQFANFLIRNALRSTRQSRQPRHPSRSTSSTRSRLFSKRLRRASIPTCP